MKNHIGYNDVRDVRYGESINVSLKWLTTVSTGYGLYNKFNMRFVEFFCKRGPTDGDYGYMHIDEFPFYGLWKSPEDFYNELIDEDFFIDIWLLCYSAWEHCELVPFKILETDIDIVNDKLYGLNHYPLFIKSEPINMIDIRRSLEFIKREYGFVG